MDHKSSVLVITRTKNRPVFLERAIKSVLNQSMGDWFMVIINDGGDPTAVDELIAEYRDRFLGRVGVIHNQTSISKGAAYNLGLAYINSTYITIHDEDNSWSPHFLRICTNEITRQKRFFPSVKGVITNHLNIYERLDKGRLIVDHIDQCDSNIPYGILSLYSMAESNVFPPISFLYEREALDYMTSGYREELPVLEDWDFNLRFMKKFDIFCISEPLAFDHVRIEENNSNGNYVVKNKEIESYRRYICNELLREECKTGAASIGMIVNYAAKLKAIQSSIKSPPSGKTPDVPDIEIHSLWRHIKGFAKGFSRSSDRLSLVRKFIVKWRQSPSYAIKVLINYGRFISSGGRK